MDRKIKVLYSLKQAMETNHLKHVQVLQGAWHGRMVVKFLSVDTKSLKDRVKAITENYEESLEFARETKTTLFYFI